MRSAVASAVFVLALGTAGCSGSSHHASKAASTTLAPPTIRLSVDNADVAATGKAATAFPPAVQTGVLDTLNKWVDGAVVAPLRAGAAGDIAGLFTPDVVPRLTGPDRVALVDEGLPRATFISPSVQTAGLTALSGPDGAVALVTARVNLKLNVEADGGPYTVTHTGELLLEADGGVWRIAGYDVRSVRQDAAGTTTTTATTMRTP